MKKIIQATSNFYKWPGCETFRVQRFIDAGWRTRFQIVRNRRRAPLVLISKRAIKAMANNEYIRYGHWDSLQVNSPFGKTIHKCDRQQIILIAKSIMRELKIK